MSDISFRHLVHATSLHSAETMFFSQVAEWKAKRETLLLQLSDIPDLVAAHLARTKTPYAPDEKITLVDMAPTIRLANACEATANCLYAAAEISANFANKASRGVIPSSFNSLRKKCEKDTASELAISLGDLQWFRKIRELRTEWTHYSSIFIASGSDGEAMLCVRAYRRISDRVEFTTPNFSCSIVEFCQWVRAALITLDKFSGYLLNKYVIPSLPLDQTFTSAVYDKNGFPIIKPDFRFEVETITIRQYLLRAGILL
jgi:hypothetical protein